MNQETDHGTADTLERIREDPPRIDDPEMLEGVARFRLGNRMYVYETEERDDGRYIGYLGVAQARDTSEGARENEVTFLNYGPVGVLVATPTGDGEYTVRLPDRDAVSEAIRVRERRENEHRAAVTPAVFNFLDDAVEKHAAKREDVTDEFRAGVHEGMHLMADIARRELSRRRSAPYRGSKRWAADGGDT